MQVVVVGDPQRHPGRLGSYSFHRNLKGHPRQKNMSAEFKKKQKKWNQNLSLVHRRRQLQEISTAALSAARQTA